MRYFSCLGAFLGVSSRARCRWFPEQCHKDFRPYELSPFWHLYGLREQKWLSRSLQETLDKRQTSNLTRLLVARMSLLHGSLRIQKWRSYSFSFLFFVPSQTTLGINPHSFFLDATLNAMPAPNPVYPSFTLVLTNSEFASFRLPAYRSGHLARYHPYPRQPPRAVPDYLMVSRAGCSGDGSESEEEREMTLSTADDRRQIHSWARFL